MTTTVVKASSKGQITLPAPFRKGKGTFFVLTYNEDHASIKELEIPDADKENNLMRAQSASLDFWDNDEDSFWDTY